MKRWTTPSEGRYSNGWYPRIVWPYCIYGNAVDRVVDCRDFSLVAITGLEPAVRDGLLAARQRSATVNDRGDVVEAVPGVGLTVRLAAEPGVVHTVPAPPGAGWSGDGVIAYRGTEPWLWSQVSGGANEQVFIAGGPLAALAADPRRIFVEMPCLSAQAHHDPVTDTWALAGSAMGSHGTPDYQDGVLHIVTEVPADAPRTDLAPHLTGFDFPIRLPDELADVWTFGDDVPGTIGGGSRADRPNRQGIGLWPDGKPWLDLDRPILGVWISPFDAQQALKHYPTEAHLLALLKAYRVDGIAADVLAGYRAERAGGGWNFDAIEERIAVELCRQHGCNLTVYDDHELMEVPGSGGTRYRPQLLERAFGLQLQGLAVVLAMRTYPDGQAGWSFADCARAMMAGAGTVVDEGSGQPMTGFEWLGLTKPGLAPMPVIFTLARYTQPRGDGSSAWAWTAVARRLEEMVRIGEQVNVLGYDVFGVGRGGEQADWVAWADRWLAALLARARTDIARWPKTATAPPLPPPLPTWDSTLEQTAQAIEARARRIRDRHDDGPAEG